MNFREFSSYLERLENTSSRLEMTDILAELIIKLAERDPETLNRAIYLSLGYLAAYYETPKFNIAEKMMIRTIAKSTGQEEAEVEKSFGKLGDLGNVVFELSQSSKSEGAGRTDDTSTNITRIHSSLLEIAVSSGKGSQEDKVDKLVSLFDHLDPLSAKYVTRIVLGTTRLGFTELTVLDALAKIGEVRLLSSASTELQQTDSQQASLPQTRAGKRTKADKETDTQRKQLQKGLKGILESKYNLHPDIGLIATRFLQTINTRAQVEPEERAKTLDSKFLDKLAEELNINIEPGVPVMPQKAQRLPSLEEIVEKMGTVWAEFKFDGTRVQLHMDKEKQIKTSEIEQRNLFSQDDKSGNRILLKTFTRNLEDTTYQYPDIIQAAEEQIGAKSVILDGEAIGYDKDSGEFLPFQQIMQRKRKHDVQKLAEQIPLKYFVFDILFLDGQDLTKKPLKERQALLKNVIKKGTNGNEVITIDEHKEIETLENLKDYFATAREKGLEGLILKKPDADYRAGARDFTWVKLKVADTKLLDDSIDCVVLGYYFGKGVRSKFGIGGFLAGIYDPESLKFKTITKVGTGLKEEDFVKLKELADKHKTIEKPKNVDIDKIYTPDVWTHPKIVVELGADEVSVSPSHTAGYALRFPRLLKFRTDKKADQITTLEEIIALYNMQKRAYY